MKNKQTKKEKKNQFFISYFFTFSNAARIPEKKWPNIYWFQHEQNYLYHSQCANRLFLKNRTFCGNPKYLDGICTGFWKYIYIDFPVS